MDNCGPIYRDFDKLTLLLPPFLDFDFMARENALKNAKKEEYTLYTTAEHKVIVNRNCESNRANRVIVNKMTIETSLKLIREN